MTYGLLSIALLASSMLPAQAAKPNLYFFVDATSFSAEGTWMPVDANSHAAYQTETELDCYRRTATCTEATADYFSGHPHISVVDFHVVKWDNRGILASSADGICATRTLTVGFAAKHISDTREAKMLPKEKQKACQWFGVPSSERWTLALKNSKTWNDERDREHMQ